MNTQGILTRRGFLGAAAVAAASVAAVQTEPGNAEAAARKKVPVGAHPWVYAATQPNYDPTPVLPDIFSDMAYAGLDGIELMHNVLRPADAVERIGELSKKHRLPIIGTSYGDNLWDRARHAAILEDAEMVITRLAKLGGRTFGMSVGGTPQKKTEEQLDAQAEMLRKLIGLCKKNGVVLNLHNHTYEVADGMHDLRGTLKRIPDAALGPDLNWLVRGGVDPVAFIREFRGQIVFLHLRDQKKDGRWSEAMGEGDMDYAAIGKALKEAGFRGQAVIELAHEGDFKPTRPLRESLKMSREYVRRTIGW